MKPAYIRRIYLQDLYRFFRLFTQRDAFENIFDVQEQKYIFFARSLFSGTPIEQHFNEITSFLIKKKRHRDAIEMLANYDLDRQDFQYFMMCAYVGQDPLKNYSRALELQPENERAMAGYARALFSKFKYQEALELFDKLLSLQPDKKSYLLNKAVCQTNLQQYDEAEKVLFRLNYESPDDIYVNRVLAWTLTCDGKYEQAEKFYEQLLSVEEPLSEDILNNGYCLWFSGRVDEAVDCFRRYLKETGQSKQFILDNEKELIRMKTTSY
jgi:tetratricopeptide (TPR) repeat protein